VELDIKVLDKSATGLGSELFSSAEFLHRQLWGPGRLATEGNVTLARRSAERDPMKTPTTHLTIEELRQVAAAKFEEAAALPEGPKKQLISKLAYNYRTMAEIRGRLASDLKRPK
jgi:hypothetical protein